LGFPLHIGKLPAGNAFCLSIGAVDLANLGNQSGRSQIRDNGPHGINRLFERILEFFLEEAGVVQENSIDSHERYGIWEAEEASEPFFGFLGAVVDDI
jgi:hypothetical protein